MTSRRSRDCSFAIPWHVRPERPPSGFWCRRKERECITERPDRCVWNACPVCGAPTPCPSCLAELRNDP